MGPLIAWSVLTWAVLAVLAVAGLAWAAAYVVEALR